MWCSICYENYAEYQIYRCEKRDQNYCKCCLERLRKISVKPPGCRLCRNRYFSSCKNVYKGKFDFYEETNTSLSWLKPTEWIINKFRLSESALNVRARTYVENKMSEAVIKTCKYCNVRFIKGDEGCNIVYCICGYTVCFICQRHPTMCRRDFACLEYSAEVDKENIMDAAKEAKKVVGNYLLIDPSIPGSRFKVLLRNVGNIGFGLGIAVLLYSILSEDS